MAATRPGTPSLSLLKSIILYFLLAPPPLWRIVILPLEFLPPLLFKLTSKDFSGSFLVISLKFDTVICLIAGEVGLNFLILIVFPPSYKHLLHSFEEFYFI